MEIKCNIIKDLLPLYTDQMLSTDSIQMVEEHLQHCESCRKVLNEIQDDFSEESLKMNQISVEETKNSFLKIRQTIWKKKLLSVAVAVGCVCGLVRIGHYFYAEKTVYIPYEESGLYMDEGKLCTDKSIEGRLYSIVSSNQKVQFYYEEETAEIRKLFPRKSVDLIIHDYENEQDSESAHYPESEIGGPKGIEKVYYLPEEYIKWDLFDYENPQNDEQLLKEIEEKSILLWERGN